MPSGKQEAPQHPSIPFGTYGPVHIRTAFTTSLWVTSSLRTVLTGAGISEEIKMKTSLFVVGLSLMFLVAGCNTTTPAAQGQPGPPGVAGQTGQVGQTGQQGDTGLSGVQGQTGDTGQTGNTGLTGDRGRTGRPGDTGETGRTGQTGDEGQAAPCPAGQHRYTDANTGRVSCVRD